MYRSMSTAVEDGAIQRATGGQEQGSGQDVWQVLGLGYIYNVFFCVQYDDLSI